MIKLPVGASAGLFALNARRVEDRAVPIQDAVPFVVVTELILGTGARPRFEDALRKIDVGLVKRYTASDWPRLSTALHTPDATPERLRLALAYEAAWAKFSPTAEIWTLKTAEDFARLVKQKRNLRARFSSRQVDVLVDRSMLSLGLHTFHTPDSERLQSEWSMVFDKVSD